MTRGTYVAISIGFVRFVASLTWDVYLLDSTEGSNGFG